MKQLYKTLMVWLGGVTLLAAGAAFAQSAAAPDSLVKGMVDEVLTMRMRPFRDGVQQYKWIFNPNPFFHLAVSYQESLFFQGAFGHGFWLIVLGGLSVLFFLAAYWLFDRLRDSFAEVV